MKSHLQLGKGSLLWKYLDFQCFQCCKISSLQVFSCCSLVNGVAMGKRKLTLKCCLIFEPTQKKTCRGTLDDFLQYYHWMISFNIMRVNRRNRWNHLTMLKVYGNKSKHPPHTNNNMSSHQHIAVHIDPRGPLWEGPRPNTLLSDCASTIWECGNTAMNEPRRKKTTRFKYWVPWNQLSQSDSLVK